MEMPGWGPARGGFRWIPGTDVETLLLLREYPGLTIPGCSLGPFLLRANSFVRPPRKPASPPGPWRLYSRHRCCRHPCPTAYRPFLCPHPHPRPHRPSRVCRPGPLDVSALPRPGCLLRQLELQSAQRAPRGADFSRRHPPPGTVGSCGRRRNGPGVVPGRCTG